MEYRYEKIVASSRTNSRKINRAFKDIASDLYDQHMNILESQALMGAEQLANNDTVNYMMGKISQLETAISSLDASKLLFTAFDSDSILFPSSIKETEKAMVYGDYGQITLPILESDAQLMQLNEETGELTLIDDAMDYVAHYLSNNKYTDRVDAVFQNDILAALNTDMADPFYVRALATNPNITFVEDILAITLPVPADINTIKLIPLPEFNITIHDILQTTDVTKNTIRDVLGNTLAFPKENAVRNIYHMPTYKTTDVTFKLRQASYSSTNGTKEYRLGIRYVALENNIYSNEGYIMFRVPYSPAYPILHSITMDWDADEGSNVYVYDNIDDANELTDNTVFSGTGNNIVATVPHEMILDQDYYIVIEMRPISMTDATPVFRGCTVNRIANA